MQIRAKERIWSEDEADRRRTRKRRRRILVQIGKIYSKEIVKSTKKNNVISVEK